MKKIFMLLLVLSLAAACDGLAAEAAGDYGKRVLVAYFSLYGNSEYPEGADATSSASIVERGNTRSGTTEYIARMIGDSAGGELYAIRTADKYPADFDEVIEKNHEEIDRGVMPPLSGAMPDISKYDAVFIGYPVWADTVPRPVLAFISRCGGFAGKTVIPFCTHDGYGSGRSYGEIFSAAPDAEHAAGIDVAAGDAPSVGKAVAEWLKRIGMAKKAEAADRPLRALRITAGSAEIRGILFDTPLVREIGARLPLTVYMSGFGGREYYGGIYFAPKNGGDGGFALTTATSPIVRRTTPLRFSMRRSRVRISRWRSYR